MDKKNELVSIVLPVYNGEKYLSLSIESVIKQTYKNWELIIIDDCSTDGSAEIAKGYAEKDSRIHYYKNEVNLRLPRGLNRGFSIAKGDYLTWTSDDNLYFPNAIEKMVETLRSEHTEFVFATCEIINEHGEVIEIIKCDKDYKKSIIGGNCVGACFMYTRKVYEVIGEYDPDKFLVEDYDYWLRIFSRFDVSNIQDTLYQYRFHSGALTSTQKKEKINSVCEEVVLTNIKRFGKLDWLQKYYLYQGLHRLREVRTDKKERDFYLSKYRFYRTMYLLLRRIPRKMRIIK